MSNGANDKAHVSLPTSGIIFTQGAYTYVRTILVNTHTFNLFLKVAYFMRKTFIPTAITSALFLRTLCSQRVPEDQGLG